MFDREVVPTADWGFVLGSGLGGCGLGWELVHSLGFVEAGLKKPCVSGHAGSLEWRKPPSGGVILLARGRLHAYEGYSKSQICQIIGFFAKNSIRNCLLTCAAGGVSPDLIPGTAIAIENCIPIRSANCWKELAKGADSIGYQIPGCKPCPVALQRLLSFKTMDGHYLKCGKHIQMTGPNYETRAEVRMMKMLGISTVGMSIGVELEAAKEFGLSAAGLAVVSNHAAEIGMAPITHTDVLKNLQKATLALEILMDHLVLETRSFQTDQ